MAPPAMLVAQAAAVLGELAERRALASGEAGGRPVEQWRAAIQPPTPCGLSVITGETSPVAGVFTVFTDSSQPFIAATTPGDDEPFAL